MSRIVVATSDPTSRRIIEGALSDSHEVLFFPDGWSTIDVLYETGADAAITELDLPGLSGLGVLAAAHAHDPMLPVLLLSGVGSLETAVEALRLGAYDYIVKPLQGEAVRASVERALDARRLREDGNRLVFDLRRTNQFKAHMLRTVSHDFKNLLTVIRGYGSLAQSGDQEMVPRCLDRILLASRFMESLADDLATYGALDAQALVLNPTSFELRECIEHATRTFMFDAEEHRLHLPAETPWVLADPCRTTQVLINLLSNAIKYSPRGGDIRVRVGEADDEVVCAVSDSGLGIPRDQMEQLFRPFFRLDRDRLSSTPGTGLGLTIVKNLVELQGGRIWVDSEEGRGTTFSFTMPTAKAMAA